MKNGLLRLVPTCPEYARGREIEGVKSRSLSRATCPEPRLESSARERSRGKSRGFTLIEILVVIVIVGLLIVGGVSTLGVKRKEKDVKTTAEKLRTYIMEARSMAMTPKDTSFGLQKVKVKITRDPNKVEIFEVKSGGETNTNLIFEIPKNIQILPPTSPANGNMTCVSPPTCTGWYFSFVADSSNSLGQVTDSVGGGDVFIDVSQVGELWHLQVNQKTGSVSITNP